MSDSHLLIEHVHDKVRKITLNRPKQFNALSGQTVYELAQGLVDFQNSDSSVLILTGSGRAFCFGADFTEFENPSQLPDLLDQFQRFILQLYECPKVTIACINGFATGAGFDLALACDFRFALERAKVGEAYISMGLVPDCGGSFFLPRMVGTANALRLLIGGESLSAQDAKTLGLVHEVYTADELSAETLNFAQAIADKPKAAVRLIKALVRHNATVDLKAALRNERDAQLQCFDDPVHQQIVRDFLAKRNR